MQKLWTEWTVLIYQWQTECACLPWIGKRNKPQKSHYFMLYVLMCSFTNFGVKNTSTFNPLLLVIITVLLSSALCLLTFHFWFFLSVFNLQILMSVRRAPKYVTEASAATPRGRTSACALTVSCRPTTWRPAWVTDAHLMPERMHLALLLLSF